MLNDNLLVGGAGNLVLASTDCCKCHTDWKATHDGTQWTKVAVKSYCGACALASDWVQGDDDCTATCTTDDASTCSQDGDCVTPNPPPADPSWTPTDCKPNCIYTWEAVCENGAWTKQCLSATCGKSADGKQTLWVVDPENPQRRTCTIAGSNSCTDDGLPSQSCLIADSPTPTDPQQSCVNCHDCAPEIPYALTLSGPPACTMGGSSAQLYPFQATAPDNWPGLTAPYPPCLWWIPAAPGVDTWTLYWYDSDPGNVNWTGAGWYGYCNGAMNPAQKFSSNRCDPRGSVGGYTVS